jgi:copper chaperone CopZ
MKFASLIVGIFSLLLFATASSFAKTDEVRLLTNAHCSGCKTKIEKALKKIDGVELASLDLPSKVVAVKFNSEKTNIDALIAAIKKAGYEAAVYSEKENINLPEHKDSDFKDKTKKHDYPDKKSNSESKNKTK